MYCDICGKKIKTKNVYGYEFHGKTYGAFLDMKLCMCSACSRKLFQQYLDFVGRFEDSAYEEALRTHTEGQND